MCLMVFALVDVRLLQSLSRKGDPMKKDLCWSQRINNRMLVCSMKHAAEKRCSGYLAGSVDWRPLDMYSEVTGGNVPRGR